MPSAHKSARHLAVTDEQAQRLAAAVRERRHRVQLSQEALAAAAGLTVGHVRRIERAVANPTLATLRAVANALGATVGDLVD